MKTIYPYDPDAKLASNRATDDVDINVYPNAFKVVVPESAPFYRFDLEVRDSANRLLVEGLDYYLGYYSKDISEATGKPVYGGIMLFDTVTAEVTLRAVGGNHMVPMSEVGRFLTDPELEDPRNTDWSELQRYPTIVEPVDKPDSIEEALQKDVVVKALDGVRANILKKIGDLDVKYTDLIQALEDVAIKIHDHQLYIHHDVPHQHKYTRADLNVLGVDETAVDAVKAYGLTLQEVVDEMVTFGINQSRVDDLLNDDLARIVKGAFNVTSANDLILQHESGNAKITLDNAEFRMETTAGEIVYEADTEFADAGIGLEIGAGYNVLLVPSNGANQGGSPSFNGKVLITTDNILDFLHKPDSAQANVHSVSTATLELAGRGVASSPFKANAIPPIADAGTTGLWRITDSLLITGDGYGISQWALNQIKNSLDNYVDKTFSVNGEVFGDDETITLTKTHIGLDKAQNTAPDDKPVTTALTNATANKALDGHTHAKSDLKNVPTATNSAEGIGALHDVIDDTTNKFATPRAGMELAGLIDNVEEDVSGRVKAGAASATFYGGSGYLPVPALGNYGHANYKYPFLFGEEEGSNKFIFLTSGASSFGFGVYYNEVQLSDAGDLLAQSRTSVEYLPKFLEDRDLRAQYVLGGTPGIFRIVDSENGHWIILTRGTMDMTKHIATKCGSLGNNWRPFIHRDYIYVIGYWSGRNVHLGFKRALLSNIAAGTEIVWEDVVFTGKDIYENDVSGSTIDFAPIDMSTDPTAQALIYRNDNGKWSGIDPSHATQNLDMGQEGNKVRVFGYHRPYLSNSYTSGAGSPWTDSTTLNLDDHTFEIADRPQMRCELTEGAMLTPGGNNGWTGISPNNSSMRIHGKKFMLSGYWQGSSYPNRATIYKRPEGVSNIDLMARNKPDGIITKSTIHVGGEQPTVVSLPSCDFAWKDENTLLYYDNNTGYNEVMVDPDNPYPDDDGLGPTTHRKSSTIGRSILNRIPRICGDDGYNEGFTGIPGERRKSKHVDVTFTNEYVFDKANGDAAKLVTRQVSLDDGVITSDRLISDSLMLIVFGDPKNPIKAFITYTNYAYYTDDRDKKRVVLYLFDVDLSVAGDVLTVDLDTITKIGNGTVTSAATSLSGGVNGYGTQSIAYPTSDGGWHFSIQNGFYSGWVGWGGYGTIRHTIRPDLTSQTTFLHHNNSFLHRYYLHHPKMGLMELSYSSSGDSVIGNKIGSTADEVISNAKIGSGVVLSTRAAEGWIIYFTQDMPFYADEVLYTVPESDFDLRALFPGSEQDRTFYIHVDVTDGTPKYTIDEAIKPDTTTRLWIGYVTTDKERIIDLQVDRARRLGSIAPLLQHAHNKYAHRYDVADSLVASEYSLLENKGMVHDFDVVSFKDVFDSWYRFSHNHTGNYPASAAELLQWRYLENTDTIENLTNSSTFIGFISDKMAGDYVFNTVVSSNNNDDDGIFIVLAAFKQGDIDSKEHTLSLQMNTGGFGTTTPYVCIQKNHAQSSVERIFTLDPNSDGSNTGRGWSPADGYETFHVYAKREKNRLLVYVARKLLPKQTGIAYEKIVGDYVDSVRGLQIADFEAEGYLVADLDLADVAPEFARATRFGYGSLSQPVSRFWNIERPLSNLDSFYSSEQMVLESMAKADGMYKKVYGQTLRSSVGDKLHPSNHAYLAWPKAVPTTFQGNPSGTYMRPPGSKLIAPTAVYTPGDDHTCYFRKNLTFGSTTLRVNASADDRLDLYIDGALKDTAGTAILAEKDFAVVAGERSIAFGVWNGPGGSPAYGAFAIKDYTTALDVSDETWYCDDGNGGADNIKVAKVTYIIPGDTTDVFNVYPKVSTEGVAPNEAFPPVHVAQPDGTIEVSRFVDVTHGDVAWEISMIKKKI